MYHVLLARLKWLKSLLQMHKSHIFGNAATRLAARHSLILARMQVMFESTRQKALKNFKGF